MLVAVKRLREISACCVHITAAIITLITLVSMSKSVQATGQSALCIGSEVHVSWSKITIVIILYEYLQSGVVWYATAAVWIGRDRQLPFTVIQPLVRKFFIIPVVYTTVKFNIITMYEQLHI